MLEFTLLAIAVFILGPWGILHGRLYRKPIFLVIWGLGLALVGGFFAHVLENGASIPVFVSHFPDLELSATLIGFTVAATGGSLVASGIILQTQHLARVDKISADKELQSAKETLDIVRREDDELKSIAKNLSNEEFWERLNAIRRAYVHSHEKLVKAMERAKALELP